MSAFLLFCLYLLCMLHKSEACAILENCTLQLKDLINHTNESEDISTMIPLCLNFVDTRSKLQSCETEAVQTCGLGGHEPEYQSYTQQKIAARMKCLEDCPEMNEVKICQGYIKYDVIQTSGYSQFCSSYNSVRSTCVDTRLKSCSFRHQLFESGLSTDGRRIVQTICQSGCATIDKTIASIDSCSKQYSVTIGDGRFSDCSFYDEYISCIQAEPSCQQFRRVAQYSQPELASAQAKCEPTTISSSTSTSTTSVTDNLHTVSSDDEITTDRGTTNPPMVTNILALTNTPTKPLIKNPLGSGSLKTTPNRLFLLFLHCVMYLILKNNI